MRAKKSAAARRNAAVKTVRVAAVVTRMIVAAPTAQVAALIAVVPTVLTIPMSIP